MSTDNLCFRREIRKISSFFDEKSALSVAMIVDRMWHLIRVNIVCHSYMCDSDTSNG